MRQPKVSKHDINGVIVEHDTYCKPTAIPAEWEGWAVRGFGAICCEVGHVTARISLIHAGRPRGEWHAGAYRHITTGRCPSFTIQGENCGTPAEARDAALRLANELNEAISEAAALRAKRTGGAPR